MKPSRKIQGIIFIIISALFFAVMNLFVRLAGDIPTMQKTFFRNLIALFVAFIILAKNPAKLKTAKGNMPTIILRSLFGVAGIICNFYAVDHMTISDASILNKLSPFFVIVFSLFILKEKPSKIDWIAVAVAFGGALFVVRPSFSIDVLPAFIGVLGGLAAGAAYTLVRKAAIGGADGNIIILIFSLVTCFVSLPFLIFDYKPMEWRQLLYLLGAGVAAAIGQIFITAAYSKAPAKEISLFDYSIVIFASVLGFVFLDQIPDIFSYIGYAVIIGAAAFKWLYENAKDKRAVRVICGGEDNIAVGTDAVKSENDFVDSEEIKH